MNLSAETVSNFFHDIYLDDLQDPFNPLISFWDLDLNFRKITDFSNKCVINSPAPLTLNLDKNSASQIIGLIEDLKKYHSELNYQMYSSIIDSKFHYKTDLVGFSIANQIGSMFSVLPIVEISGEDADSINNAILLIT